MSIHSDETLLNNTPPPSLTGCPSIPRSTKRNEARRNRIIHAVGFRLCLSARRPTAESVENRRGLDRYSNHSSGVVVMHARKHAHRGDSFQQSVVVIIIRCGCR